MSGKNVVVSLVYLQGDGWVVSIRGSGIILDFCCSRTMRSIRKLPW